MAFARQIDPHLPASPQLVPGPDGAVQTTLLELVQTIGEITEDEADIVATVIHMLRSGHVKLAGTFRDEPIRKLLD